jgi:hypothetical protein
VHHTPSPRGLHLPVYVTLNLGTVDAPLCTTGYALHALHVTPYDMHTLQAE